MTEAEIEAVQRRRRCVATVWHRDTYRRTGVGKSGFEMHYNQNQCSRATAGDGKFCSQHQHMQDSGHNLLITDWWEFVEP